MNQEYKQQDITSQIIDAAYTVHNTIGYGFLEKVYRNALAIEIGKRNLLVESEKQLDVFYEGKMVGHFFADLIVNGNVIVEVKATDEHNTSFEAQLLNYLKASGIEVGLILNFGRSVRVKRMVM